MSHKFIAVACLSVAGAAGCQCFPATESYQNVIDHVADHEPHLDHWYCAGLDLTRIGYPDWCQYRFNHLFMDPSQCRGCRVPPGYEHNPIYIQPRVSPEPMPIPTPPSSEPNEREMVNPAAPAMPTDQLQPIRDPSQLDKGIVPPPLMPPPAPGIPLPPE